MEKYFNIRYEFDEKRIHKAIDDCICKNDKGYICVADGVILSMADKDPNYAKVLSGSLFSICDSGWVPLYLKWIYGINRDQYCGSQIFKDVIKKKKYNMMFLGTSDEVLIPLKKELSKKDSRIAKMQFKELPFCTVDEFDYKSIAVEINKCAPDVIWIALGAPKQEVFMNRLLPYIDKGVMIAVGAAFNFFCGQNIKRAPDLIVKAKLEFAYRIYSEPKKQIKRCGMIIKTMPNVFRKELGRRKVVRKRYNLMQNK